jgi:FkbM family methyltransferase
MAETLEKKTYSQNDEETYIVGWFDKLGIKSGRFLDIGAYDGKAFSNTFRLVELGWGGVCIEPSPSVFPALLKLHADNPNIILINAAVSTHSGSELIEFFDSGGDAISTTNVEHRDKWQKGWNVAYKKFRLWSLPLNDVFREFGYQFEFVNIDTESTNIPIFNALPIELMTGTRVICVEHDNQGDLIAHTLAPFGFTSILSNGENIILAR